jgi:hypothetical protein
MPYPNYERVVSRVALLIVRFDRFLHAAYVGGNQKETPQYKRRFLLKNKRKTAFILRGPFFANTVLKNATKHTNFLQIR